jgi:hypothetical protein
MPRRSGRISVEIGQCCSSVRTSSAVMKAIIGVVLLLFFGGVLCADDLVFESGLKKVQLLELFTSEGCSSCPPAEAALARLVSDQRLWHEFVPVAFHVDYWDRLGWKDPFASAEWTRRQRLYAANWNAESVYTPAFVLNGREWQNASVPVINNAGAPGLLKATVRRDHAVVINFEPANGNARDFDVYLACLGFGININVRAGENNGRSLRHDFVVLSLDHQRLVSSSQEFHLPSPALETTSRPNRTALAAWITRADDITPLQAIGGWLPHNSAGEN